jgi:hypothetical protein
MLAQQDGTGDPAVAGLKELIDSEVRRARTSEPELLEQADPSRVWLLWFAIGATDAVCELTGRRTDIQRDYVFRQVVAAIFDGKGVRSVADQVDSDRRLIELFESAGAEAVAACMRDEPRLGYYVEALRVSRRRDG